MKKIAFVTITIGDEVRLRTKKAIEIMDRAEPKKMDEAVIMWTREWEELRRLIIEIHDMVEGE